MTNNGYGMNMPGMGGMIPSGNPQQFNPQQQQQYGYQQAQNMQYGGYPQQQQQYGYPQQQVNPSGPQLQFGGNGSGYQQGPNSGIQQEPMSPSSQQQLGGVTQGGFDDEFGDVNKNNENKNDILTLEQIILW
eukprot:CAMPEP_0201593344 /NCGR_PEP_ID=MMETSP0190_2-20130828/190973_1 /ASSEMBLY_ACC=CAM_ASM_000263 /TAXON_ID=37353 /ORGANISM="Rosalina sp." /LENGTH=131 /DNA_ID=CAMNT_0048052493 /DNA_START=72 /DNA_END=464 /DNA_ORIENTATION=-